MPILGNTMMISAVAGTAVYDIITSSNTTSFNLRTALDALGFNNSQPSQITYTLESGVTIGGSSTPAWQTGTISPNHTLVITINGSILGGAGGGAAQTTRPASATCYSVNGQTGGDAMYFEASGPTATVTFASSAVLRGGGGGGGSGGSSWVDEEKGPGNWRAYGGAGGDGQGYSNESGPSSGSSGQVDTNATGGTGATGGAWGTVGGIGESGNGDITCTGGSGGVAGYYVRKNSNTVNITDNGATTSGLIG